jgi:hypothetical protein
MESPYDYFPGDLVEVRVAAENQYGRGQFDIVTNEGARIPPALPIMQSPSISDRTIYTVKLSWDPVSESFSTGH